MAEEGKCCTPMSEVSLDQTYWNNQYKTQTTGWDLGEISPPIKHFIDNIENKEIKILIPGCGNSYEAEYLLRQGFKNVTLIDIAPVLVETLQQKFAKESSVRVLLGDFFEHQGNYDIIIEQTFFCALPPSMRQKYVFKTHQLLAENGVLVGLLFNRSFEKSPPFGGTKAEYEHLFNNAFQFLNLETSSHSIAPRANSELWIEFQKNKDAVIKLYSINGITCSGCATDITNKIKALPFLLNASINSNFTEILIVSSNNIEVNTIEKAIETNEKKYTLT